MANVKEIHIPPMSARAFTVDRGQTIRIIDLAGGQHMAIKVTRCIKHTDRCFEIGTSFLKQPPECG